MTELAPRAADANHLSPPFESECGLFLGGGKGHARSRRRELSTAGGKISPYPSTARRRDRGGRSHATSSPLRPPRNSTLGSFQSSCQSKATQISRVAFVVANSLYTDPSPNALETLPVVYSFKDYG